MITPSRSSNASSLGAGAPGGDAAEISSANYAARRDGVRVCASGVWMSQHPGHLERRPVLSRVQSAEATRALARK